MKYEIASYRLRKNKKRTFVLLFFILHTSYFILFSGCYSFTGASIPPYIHTIGIPMVEDNSGFGQSAIPQNITNELVQKFTTDGSLRVASVSQADAKVRSIHPRARRGRRACQRCGRKYRDDQANFAKSSRDLYGLEKAESLLGTRF